MPESFGAGLRQRREQQQIALTTIAEQTKINVSLLEALERDDVSRWPSGIFRRAFVRAYAHAIGLDPDVIVREFQERHPDPADVAATVSALAADAAASVSGAPPTRFRHFVGAAIDSLSHLPLGINQRGRGARRGSGARGLRSGESGQLRRSPTSWLPRAFAPSSVGLTRHMTRGRCSQEAARILDAVGLIVWVWDPQATELRPALAHGYPARVLAQLPRVRRDADNATAAAFRSAQTSVVPGSKLASGALAVPLMTPAGCSGVLAIELAFGSAQSESVRALVTIFAAQLARLIGTPRATETVDRKLA